MSVLYTLMEIKPKQVLVFVALGRSFDDLLIASSLFASRNAPEFLQFLITDNPAKYSDFQGTVIPYVRNERTFKSMEILKMKKRSLVGIAGNYWFLTFERLLALELLKGFVDAKSPIIHLENDILSFIDESVVDTWQKKYRKSAVLRWSSYANAGIIFVPNLNELIELVDRLHTTAREVVLSDSWTIDMQILRNLLDDQSIEELPTVIGYSEDGDISLTSDLSVGGRRMICDSVDIGTYLLGRNSVYSEGKIYSGYRYSHINWPIEKSQWKLERFDRGSMDQFRLLMKLSEEVFTIPFLHVNSKLNLVDNNLGLLIDLFGLDTWISKCNFPKSGISAKTIHQRNFIQRFKALVFKF